MNGSEVRDVAIGPCRLILADCRDVLDSDPGLRNVPCIVTDPPYGETSLDWDVRVKWQALARLVLADTGSLWCFGSMRFFIEEAAEFAEWKIAQDLIWEKHNGSNASNDRFRRVHEIAVQFYKSHAKWESVFKNPLFTNDATARSVRRKKRPTQWGELGASSYESQDGGPRMMRSVMFCRSCHGKAVHPTQKPLDTVIPLVEYSSRPGDTVLDMFMGSGTTGLACMVTGRRFIGIENDPERFEVACKRIKSQLDIPRTSQELLFADSD